MERRDFLKTTCSFCLTLGTGILTSGLSSCSSGTIYNAEKTGNTIAVPLSLFAENPFHIIRSNNFDYDIALRQEENGTYTALLLRCTHAANQLISKGNSFTCSLHGSTFNKNGIVTRGPAERPLQNLTTQISGTNILISLN
jgi:Rieske Fe-S protein